MIYFLTERLIFRIINTKWHQWNYQQLVKNTVIVTVPGSGFSVPGWDLGYGCAKHFLSSNSSSSIVP